MTDKLKMIDRWFPCAAVDEAVKLPLGSGRNEKAIFTWFASRPVAQARAAVLTSLLPREPNLHDAVNAAILLGDSAAFERLRKVIADEYPDENQPVVLDMFSGRGMIPLESCRLGYRTIGLDLSPVATLAGMLLCDFPFRDWSEEPAIPFADPDRDEGSMYEGSTDLRLVSDVRAVVVEVGRRTVAAVEEFYPRNSEGEFPWGYLWALSITCDGCSRRFPLMGSTTLRHPYKKTEDPGQAFRLVPVGDSWRVIVHDGTATAVPTYSAPRGKRGKVAKCLFCSHVHERDTVKQKGFDGDYRDDLIAVADRHPTYGRVFRTPTDKELDAATPSRLSDLCGFGQLSAVPDEKIGPGNTDTVRASGYGYTTFGSLTNSRQARYFVEIVRAIREVAADLRDGGVSDTYAAALAAYASANLVRTLKVSTRGARLRGHGKPDGKTNNRLQVDHIFANESMVGFNFDYFETAPGAGAGTWDSAGVTGARVLQSHMDGLTTHGRPATIRRADATALPLRDNSVDVVVTDPPYGNMIDYSDASDLFYVWLRRALFDIFPDLFGTDDQLQPKDTEAIEKRGATKGDPRTADGYQKLMERAFREARRVLKPGGTMTVVFGQADPDAWRYLLTALNDAGFIITGSWPARTETAATGVASIRVTITLSCRVGPDHRPTGIGAAAEAEAVQAIKQRVPEWRRDGLALHDQIMAAYGPAMEVFGSYESIQRPDGSTVGIDRFLALAVIAVRDAASEPVETIPLETFDAITRLSIFWLRAHGTDLVHKGEARFYAQADELDIGDLHGTWLEDSKKAGYRINLGPIADVDRDTPTVGVARALSAAWKQGASDAVAEVLVATERDPDDSHLWAVLQELSTRLPASHAVAKAISDIIRNRKAILSAATATVTRLEEESAQPTLDLGTSS